MILMMGGKVHSRVTQCNHILIDSDDYKYLRSDKSKEEIKAAVLNFKYLFHTYFFFKRMDINDEEYKIITN
jgi:hypothetical protein